MMDDRKYGWLTTAVLTFVLALVLMFPAGKALAARPIKIGLLDAYSGGAAAFTKPALVAWQVVVDEFNAKGGLHGRKIEIITRDTKFNPEQAVSDARELILKNGVDFLAGTISSACALAISQFAKTKKKLFIVHIARSARITGEKGNKYVFRGCPDTDIEGGAGGAYAATKPYHSWYIIGDDYEYGHAIADSFWNGLVKNKPDVVKVGDVWAKLKETDYTPYLTALMAKKPDAVCAAFGAADLISFTKQAKLFGLFEKVPVFEYALGDSIFPQVLKQNMPVGAYGGINYLWYYPDNAANKAFVARYREVSKKEGHPDLYPSGLGSFGGYCSAKFLTEAILKADSVKTDKVIKALEGLTIQTALGPIQMRACDHQAMTPTFWGETANVPGYPFPILKDIIMTPADKVIPSCEEIAKERKKAK
jgi:branched-chain amino acid transport system substrate-binding protein